MASINNLAPTSELEAVNAMLSAIGEAPITDLDSSTDRDVQMAVGVLREAAREVQTQRWRFNSEYKYAVSPAGQVGGLNVFEVPAGLIRFDLSRVPEQRGMDLVIRPSRVYQPVGTPVFFDRLRGNDGVNADKLLIDPVWFLDFEDLPETARRYITVLAARRFAQDQTAAPELAAFSEQDEQQALLMLQMDQRGETPLVPDGEPSEEVDAINEVLAGSGIGPIVSADAIPEEAAVAVNTLRATSREVQLQGWEFNTEFGYELAPTDTMEWTDRAGNTFELNIFEPPKGLGKFRVSRNRYQQGQYFLDTTLRRARVYTDDEGNKPIVFYDREFNRDGFQRAFIYIDPVWILDFDELPEQARQYITILATRRYAQRTRGDANACQYDERDLFFAKRELKRSYGAKDNLNIFQNLDVFSKMGRRPLGPSGAFDDWRSTPGPA